MNKEQIDAYRDFAKEKLGFEFKNIDDLIKQFKNIPPKVNHEDLRIIETKTEMEDFFRNAEEEVNKLSDE